MKMATDAIKNHFDLKRKVRVPEVIEISSDSEPEIWPSKVRHSNHLCGWLHGPHHRGKR